jgi:hypothetical protein
MAAIAAAVRDLAERYGRPVHLAAARGSCHLAWSAALVASEHLRSITLIGPTPSAMTQTPVLPASLRRAGVPLHRVLGTGAALRWFLKRSFSGEVDEPFLAHAAATARLRDARGAGVSRFHGSLAGLDRARRRPHRIPVHLVRSGGVLDAGWAEALRRLPQWEDTHLPMLGGMIHYEFASSAARAMRLFFAELDGVRPPPRQPARQRLAAGARG